jgi:hypothetical protein
MLTALTYLTLDNNAFTGAVPSELGSLNSGLEVIAPWPQYVSPLFVPSELGTYPVLNETWILCCGRTLCVLGGNGTVCLSLLGCTLMSLIADVITVCDWNNSCTSANTAVDVILNRRV